MRGLARPDVPPGAQRDLVDALHALHHEAGWPSLRGLAREAGCSHTTVSTVFSSPKLPSWGVVELVVEAMGGDVEEFRRLWVAASSPGAPTAGSAPGIAGRRDELAAVRRHLDHGTGMLLVAGEAGIGKTRLVDTATSSMTRTFVARGACLPLATQVPLLPITDVLRSVFERDEGRWLEKALADRPPYVVPSLHRLLPELDERVDVSAVPEDDWWRQRLFSAVGTTLSALADLSPLALLVEDLHWADATTLDLLEYLLTRPPRAPLLATFRLDDASTSTSTREWFDRVRRLPTVTTLELGPLTRDETADLLALIGAGRSTSEVDRLHQRSAGIPLFTEQLAAQADDQEPLPGPIADLLDRRFADIGEEEWAIARALGVADRPLSATHLRALTGLSPDALTAELHSLDEQRLVVGAGDDVRLRHPLLAEAVRRRLVAGEATDAHRRLALVLAESPNPSAAEIAEHWQRADDPEQEIVWRIRAAHEAAARFASLNEADQWRRVLALWPDGEEYAGTPSIRKIDAHLAAMNALMFLDWPAASAIADEALESLADPDGPDVAEVYQRAAGIQGNLGNPGAGLELVDLGLRILDPTREPAAYARALLTRAHLLKGLDRLDEAAAASALAAELSADLENPGIYRDALIAQVGDDMSGGLERALERLRTAARIETDGPDPQGDLYVATIHTHVLLTACRSVDEVADAARPGLEAAAAWGIDDFLSAVLLSNLSEALRHAGRVQEAAALIDPVTGDPLSPHRWPTYSERGLLDLLRGRRDQATSLLDAVSEFFVIDLANRAVCAQDAPTADLWCGRPQAAYDRLCAALAALAAAEDEEVDVAGLLVLTARAAADLADAPTAGAGLRRRLLAELEDVLGGTRRDPFGASDIYRVRPALRATWTAEMARLAGTPSLDRWVTAAAEWDRIGRPHDSAYARWRGAEVALATGQASAAINLLRRAGRDAREHVPLMEAVRATAAVPRGP